MATTVTLEYGVTFGKGDSSDWIEYEITLTGEAEAAYLEEMKKEDEYDRCFSDHPSLVAALEEAYDEIKDVATADLCEAGDEYAQSFHSPDDTMYASDIEDLIYEKDPQVMAFFGLTEMSEEELDDWIAELEDKDDDELPTYGDVFPDMEESSPFDEGYSLSVHYYDDPECSY